MERVNIAIATDNNYTKHCAVVMTSAVVNAADDDDLHFYILDGGISDKNVERLKKISANVNIVKINEELFIPYKKIVDPLWALPTLFRMVMASVLPDIDKIIYLDCDVIVKKSLKELFQTDLENYSIAAVCDYANEASAKRLAMKDIMYFNAGVNIANLKRWRELNKEQDCISLLERTLKDEIPIVFGDQDIMNLAFEGSVCYLDRKFNYIVPSSYLTKNDIAQWKKYRDEVVIIHYAGQKPWEYFYKSVIKDEYWHYYKMTEWQNDEPAEKFLKKQKFLNFKPFLMLRFMKRYPFFLFTEKRGEFCRFFN